MTWPFENDTSAVVHKLAYNSMRANRRRNLFATIAVSLTAFMITSIFSIGFSYFETFRMQQDRFMGTTADAAVTNPTEEQINQLKNMSFVSDIGISQRIGNVETSGMENALLGLVWLDDTEWQSHRLPTITNVKGAYPAARNEVMMPTWILEQMGISNPQLGMTIELPYQLNNTKKVIREDFTLSGYYTDYVFLRTDNKGSVYVSAAFKNAVSASLHDGGSVMITFSNDEMEKNCGNLKKRLDLAKWQTLEAVPVKEADRTPILCSLAFIILLVMFSGYLFIYNIFYISISRDTQFFGQLKTLGATQKQIKKIVYRQIRRLSFIGITGGLLLGAIFSFFIVPYALNGMIYSGNAEAMTQISFSPFIFIGAAFFTFLTAMVSSMKPAQIAASISPIAAVRYIGNVTAKKSVRHRKNSVKIAKMAWENIFRDKKSASFVFASLCLGLCLFLVTTGLFSSLSPENFVNQWGEADFVLTYDSASEAEPFSEEILSEISSINGVGSMELTYVPAHSIAAAVVYDEAVFEQYISSLDGKSGLDFSNPENIAAYTQNFYSGIYGIDSSYAQKFIKSSIDIERFQNGETVILRRLADSNGKTLFQPGQKIAVTTSTGLHTFEVAEDFIDAGFQMERGHWRGTAPDLFISTNAMKKFFPDNRIFRVAFDTSGEEEEVINLRLQTIVAQQPEIKMVSRYDKRIEMGEYITTIKVLGFSISLILMLIGVMNFINTMTVSVNARRHEFAILESIGMTKRQVKRMLLYEGSYYFGISFALAVILGSGLYWFLYPLFARNVSYAVFYYPLFPMLLSGILILLVCLIVPMGTYKTEIRNSVVERLRITESV